MLVPQKQLLDANGKPISKTVQDNTKNRKAVQVTPEQQHVLDQVRENFTEGILAGMAGLEMSGLDPNSVNSIVSHILLTEAAKLHIMSALIVGQKPLRNSFKDNSKIAYDQTLKLYAEFGKDENENG